MNSTSCSWHHQPGRLHRVHRAHACGPSSPLPPHASPPEKQPSAQPHHIRAQLSSPTQRVLRQLLPTWPSISDKQDMDEEPSVQGQPTASSSTYTRRLTRRQPATGRSTGLAPAVTSLVPASPIPAALPGLMSDLLGALAAGQDVLALGWPHGAHRTLAYLAPIIEQTVTWRSEPVILQQHRPSTPSAPALRDRAPRVRAVIVCTSSAAAKQVHELAYALLTQHDAHVQLVTGRSSLQQDIVMLRSACPDILIATPGRLAQLLTEAPRGCQLHELLGDVKLVVLDQAVSLMTSTSLRPMVESALVALRALRQELHHRPGLAQFNASAAGGPVTQPGAGAKPCQLLLVDQENSVTDVAAQHLAAARQIVTNQKSLSLATQVTPVARTGPHHTDTSSSHHLAIPPSLGAGLHLQNQQLPAGFNHVAHVIPDGLISNGYHHDHHHADAEHSAHHHSNGTAVDAARSDAVHVHGQLEHHRPTATAPAASQDGMVVLRWVSDGLDATGQLPASPGAAPDLVQPINQELLICGVDQFTPQVMALIKSHADNQGTHRILVHCPSAALARVWSRVARQLGCATLEVHARKNQQYITRAIEAFLTAPRPKGSTRRRSTPSRRTVALRPGRSRSAASVSPGPVRGDDTSAVAGVRSTLDGAVGEQHTGGSTSFSRQQQEVLQAGRQTAAGVGQHVELPTSVEPGSAHSMDAGEVIALQPTLTHASSWLLEMTEPAPSTPSMPAGQAGIMGVSGQGGSSAAAPVEAGEQLSWSLDEDDDEELHEAGRAQGLVLFTAGGVTQHLEFNHLSLYIQVGLPRHAPQLQDYVQQTQQCSRLNSNTPPSDPLAATSDEANHQEDTSSSSAGRAVRGSGSNRRARAGAGSSSSTSSGGVAPRSILCITAVEAPGLAGLVAALQVAGISVTPPASEPAGSGHGMHDKPPRSISASLMGSAGGGGGGGGVSIKDVDSLLLQPALKQHDPGLLKPAHSSPPATSHLVPPHVQAITDTGRSSQASSQQPRKLLKWSQVAPGGSSADAKLAGQVSRLVLNVGGVLRQVAWRSWMTHLLKHTWVPAPPAHHWPTIIRDAAVDLGLAALPSISPALAAAWGSTYCQGLDITPSPGAPLTQSAGLAGPGVAGTSSNSRLSVRVGAAAAAAAAAASAQGRGTGIDQDGSVQSQIESDSWSSQDVGSQDGVAVRRPPAGLVRAHRMAEYKWMQALHRVGDLPDEAWLRITQRRMNVQYAKRWQRYHERWALAREKDKARRQVWRQRQQERQQGGGGVAGNRVE